MKLNPKRIRSDSAAAALQAHQNAASDPIEPPEYVRLPEACQPFWNAIVTARARDTWTDADLVLAANLARTQYAIEQTAVGSDDHVKLTRLALTITRAISVNTVATVGRDMANASTAERKTRREEPDPLIPRLKAV